LVRRLQHHRRQISSLAQAAMRRRPDLVICRGTTGVYGEMLQRHLGIPYVVESFEPHAHYMLQTGTWHRWDPKFLVQRRWEERVKRSASALITASLGYARHLQEHEGISSDRLRTVPCWVDAERFRIDLEARFRLRQDLGIGDRLAVVYAGKFGGIYSPLRELAMLRPLQKGLGQPLFVIVLTSADAPAVRHQLRQAGFGEDQFFVDCVSHSEVNAYLNAADLALSFINSGPWSFACSAIKHGEYWACGLPVLMPPGVGDEAQWLEGERAGAIAPFDNPQAVHAAAVRLAQILGVPGHRQRIRAIGLRERSAEALISTYRWLLTKIELKSLITF
jgi:glycosyltransferase involved in cell wall biosynthesis